MALIKCEECGRDVSDKALACQNCGAPPSMTSGGAVAPSSITYSNGKFTGTKTLLAALAVKAIQSVRYKVDQVNEQAGLIGFTTGMTMGSWSGVSGTVVLEEVEPFTFVVTGSGKQNVKGGQMIALDLFGESKAKVAKVINEMQRLAPTSG